MTLRKLLSQPLPSPPEQAQGSIVDQALAIPQLAPLRLFLENFRDLQPWWPVLVPLLLWVGLRTYRRERAAALAREP
ncbi:MAG TPA: hypothetical protein PLO33_11040 [Kouleothrix sp.]|uniref:hypothetical protein n=1 Tax=Kouleothrix sp. TaxID=2779161 RepID=UPI002C405385|nr:hypothetical protein [Kouleothrix sp.]HRC76205.1 hypothetical protein [Kouleothrix sp.]